MSYIQPTSLIMTQYQKLLRIGYKNGIAAAAKFMNDNPNVKDFANSQILREQKKVYEMMKKKAKVKKEDIQYKQSTIDRHKEILKKIQNKAKTLQNQEDILVQDMKPSLVLPDPAAIKHDILNFSNQNELDVSQVEKQNHQDKFAFIKTTQTEKQEIEIDQDRNKINIDDYDEYDNHRRY